MGKVKNFVKSLDTADILSLGTSLPLGFIGGRPLAPLDRLFGYTGAAGEIQAPPPPPAPPEAPAQPEPEPEARRRRGRPQARQTRRPLLGDAPTRKPTLLGS